MAKCINGLGRLFPVCAVTYRIPPLIPLGPVGAENQTDDFTQKSPKDFEVFDLKYTFYTVMGLFSHLITRKYEKVIFLP